ncbi:Pex29p [Nakaseomyces bracarensis]|uniref:Pex29p n=1 Tax=Nakaseomyces bracarensis TaxID=273131 RepID=UPI003871DD0F
MSSVADFFWNDSYNKNTASTIETVGSENQASREKSTPIKKKGNVRNSSSLEKVDSRDSSLNYNPGSGNVFSSSGGLQKAMTDTLVEKIIKMAIPPSSELATNTIKIRMQAGKERPSLSVPITSRNFILMNSRLSVPFLIIDEIIKVLNWVDPAYTITMLLVYTLFILRPLQICTSLPILYLVFGIMVPAYLHTHEPCQNNYLDVNRTPSQGPPLRKADIPKPVPEFSQEFILNMTDLQNHMLLYVQLYDSTVSILQKFAFFVNEQLSAAAFMLLLLLGIFNFLFIDIIVHILPFKIIFIMSGWILMAISHPNLRDRFFSKFNNEETRLRVLKFTTKCEDIINENLNYSEPKEKRVVVVYELQKYKEKHKEWHVIGYANDDYTLFSDFRINENKIETISVPTLDEIKPPVGWEWSDDSNWVLDLDPSEWVEEAFVQFVEIDTETKWVYDLNLDGTKGQYRRRLWTNRCVRKIYNGSEDRNESIKLREVSNPLRNDETNTRSIHGVSKGSMAGNTKTETDTDNSIISERNDNYGTDDSMISDILNTTI